MNAKRCDAYEKVFEFLCLHYVLIDTADAKRKPTFKMTASMMVKNEFMHYEYEGNSYHI